MGRKVSQFLKKGEEREGEGGGGGEGEEVPTTERLKSLGIFVVFHFIIIIFYFFLIILIFYSNSNFLLF